MSFRVDRDAPVVPIRRGSPLNGEGSSHSSHTAMGRHTYGTDRAKQGGGVMADSSKASVAVRGGEKKLP
jgi:hypothetical protein